VVRGMEEVGYTFVVRRLDVRLAVLGFVLFAPLAFGIGLVTDFIHPAGRPPSITKAMGTALGIFLATGVPEELLFRGVVQNLIFRWTSSSGVSVCLASVIFTRTPGTSCWLPWPEPFTVGSTAGQARSWPRR
jgi:membrane protease YdiL (CAAX protease family)